ncbi:MAG: hypothetical protein ACTIKQ_03160 [Microbacterium sp.]
MDQRDAPASVSPEAPSPDVAKAYLDGIGAVEKRRDERIDRRAMGWLDIVSGAVLGAYVTLALSMLRGEAGATFPLLLVAMGLWIQLSAGLQERNGAQRRPTGYSWWGWSALIVVLVVGFAAMFVLRLLDAQIPEPFFFVPGAIAFVAFLSRGIRQLALARGSSGVSRRAHRSLSRVESTGTAVIGLMMGAAIFVAAVPNDFVSAVATMIPLLGLVVWILSYSKPWGLPSIGAAWRWPHWALMAASAIVLVMVIASPTLLGPATWIAAGGVGAIIAVLFVVLERRGERVGEHA